MVTSDDQQIRLLSKIAKKGKGAVDMQLLADALARIGWSIEPTTLVVDLAKVNSGEGIVKAILKPWGKDSELTWISNPRYNYGAVGKDKKVWTFKFETVDAADRARRTLREQVEIVGAKPTDGTPGQLMMTAPIQSLGSAFDVKSVWLRDAGWVLTSPSGQSTTVAVPLKRTGFPEEGPLNIAALWTFLYKHGADKDAAGWIAEAKPDVIAEATATKAERQRIEQARSALPEIAKIFRDVTDRQYQAVIAFIEAMILRAVQEVQRVEQEGKRVDLSKIPAAGYAVRLMTQERDPKTGRYLWTPKDDYLKRAHAEAVQAADDAREDFVHKNTARISELSRRKGSIPTAKIEKSTGGGRGDYGGEILFTFDDGSSFVLRNKTIWKRSPLGTVFAQFPTTFHDVKLPDGKAMASPSEARMLDVFATATADGRKRSNPVAAHHRQLARRLALGG